MSVLKDCLGTTKKVSTFFISSVDPAEIEDTQLHNLNPYETQRREFTKFKPTLPGCGTTCKPWHIQEITATA